LTQNVLSDFFTPQDSSSSQDSSSRNVNADFVHVWSLADFFGVSRLKDKIREISLSEKSALDLLTLCCQTDRFSIVVPHSLVNRLIDVVANGFDYLKVEQFTPLNNLDIFLKILEKRATNLAQKHDEMEISFGSIESCQQMTSQVVLHWLKHNESLWDNLKAFRKYLIVDESNAIYLYGQGIDCSDVICELLATSQFSFQRIDKIGLKDFVALMSKKNIQASEDRIFEVVILYADLWEKHHGSLSEETVTLLLSALNVEYLSNTSMEILLMQKEYFQGSLVKTLMSKWLAFHNRHPNLDLTMSRYARHTTQRSNSTFLASQRQDIAPMPHTSPPPSPIVDTRRSPGLDVSLNVVDDAQRKQNTSVGSVSIVLPPGPKPQVLQGIDRRTPTKSPQRTLETSLDSLGRSVERLGLNQPRKRGTSRSTGEIESELREKNVPLQVEIGQGKLKLGRLFLEYTNSHLSLSGFSLKAKSHHSDSSFVPLNIHCEHIQAVHKCTMAQIIMISSTQSYNFKKYYIPDIDYIVISMEHLSAKRFRELVKLLDVLLSPKVKAKECSSYTLSQLLKRANKAREKLLAQEKKKESSNSRVHFSPSNQNRSSEL